MEPEGMIVRNATPYVKWWLEDRVYKGCTLAYGVWVFDDCGQRNLSVLKHFLERSAHRLQQGEAVSG